MAATTYKVYPGFNNQSLVVLFTRQPRMSGITYPSEVYGSDGSVDDDGAAYTRLLYDVLSYDDFNSILTQCGLSETVRSAEVTLYLRKNDTDYAYYNGIIVRPNPEQQMQRAKKRWENVVFLVNNLEEIDAP